VTACPVLAYAEAPTQMSGGYDAAILRFELRVRLIGFPIRLCFDSFSLPLMPSGRHERPPCRTRSQNWVIPDHGLLSPRPAQSP
jgi:hypothetical protein